MVRSKRLSPIKALAQNGEKVAAQALGSSLQKQQLEEQKLQQLFQYREEYLQEMDTRVRAGISGATLQRYHHFLAKLDSAIKQQQETLNRTNKQLNVSQDHWQTQRSRTKAISQVMEKMAIKEQADEGKKEVKRADELSTQAFLRRTR